MKTHIYYRKSFTFSSLAVGPAAIASTHCTYLRKDGQAELTWVAWLNAKTVYTWTIIYLSTCFAQSRVHL